MKKLLSLSFLVMVVSFTQAQVKTIVKDSLVDNRDSRVYKFVKIGEKFWMAENLKYECEGSYVYDENPKLEKKYGRLYTYEAAKNACPTGSHLPSKEEWLDLEKVVDPKEEGTAGDKLMKKTNPGFAATLSGVRNPKGKYIGMESDCFYWGVDNTVQLRGGLDGADFFVNENIEKKEYQFAYHVRCVKD